MFHRLREGLQHTSTLTVSPVSLQKKTYLLAKGYYSLDNQKNWHTIEFQEQKIPRISLSGVYGFEFSFSSLSTVETFFILNLDKCEKVFVANSTCESRCWTFLYETSKKVAPG